MKITKAYKEGEEKLTEIMQSKTAEFAFAYVKDDELLQVMPFVKCRDFLKEQILFTYYGKHNYIYGFNTKRNTPNTREYTGLLLQISNKDEYHKTLENFPILVNYEKSLGFKQLSEISIIDDKHLFVVGDPLWQQSCFTISMYSLLLRTLCYKLEGTFQSILKHNSTSVDAKYWKTMDSFDRITSRDMLVDLVAKEDLKNHSVDFIHNYTGVYYMLSTKKAFENNGEHWGVEDIKDYPLWVENWK